MLPHASAEAGRNSRKKNNKNPNPAEGWEDSFVWHLCYHSVKAAEAVTKAAGCRQVQLPGARGPASMKLEARLDPSPTLEQPWPSHLASSLHYFKYPSPDLPPRPLSWVGQSPVSLQRAKKEQSSAQGCSQPPVADSAGECAASRLASASKAPRASDHKESTPEASLNFPVTRQDGHVDRRNAGRMSGTFCADPSEERLKIPHTSAGSSAQLLSLSLPGCSPNWPYCCRFLYSRKKPTW